MGRKICLRFSFQPEHKGTVSGSCVVVYGLCLLRGRENAMDF